MGGFVERPLQRRQVLTLQEYCKLLPDGGKGFMFRHLTYVEEVGQVSSQEIRDPLLSIRLFGLWVDGKNTPSGAVSVAASTNEGAAPPPLMTWCWLYHAFSNFHAE